MHEASRVVADVKALTRNKESVGGFAIVTLGQLWPTTSSLPMRNGSQSKHIGA